MGIYSEVKKDFLPCSGCVFYIYNIIAFNLKVYIYSVCKYMYQFVVLVLKPDFVLFHNIYMRGKKDINCRRFA